MSRTAAVFASGFVLLSASFASAATVLPGKGPYTFTGTVVSATASCPYAAKSKLAGYTFNSGFHLIPSSGGQFAQNHGFELVVSPSGKTVKQGLQISGFSFLTHGPGTANGKLGVLALPSAAAANGSYTLKLTFNTAAEFSGVLGVKYGQCTASYSLAFKRGIPANLYDLL